MASDNVKRVSLYLPEEEYEFLRRVAFEKHQSMNDLVRQAMAAVSGHVLQVSGVS